MGILGKILLGLLSPLWIPLFLLYILGDLFWEEIEDTIIKPWKRRR